MSHKICQCCGCPCNRYAIGGTCQRCAEYALDEEREIARRAYEDMQWEARMQEEREAYHDKYREQENTHQGPEANQDLLGS